MQNYMTGTGTGTGVRQSGAAMRTLAKAAKDTRYEQDGPRASLHMQRGGSKTEAVARAT
jgi:hypothetical protein